MTLLPDWPGQGQVSITVVRGCTYSPCMKDLGFGTGLVTQIGLPKKQVQLCRPLPRRRARTVITSSDDEESPLHSSSLSKYRGDDFTAGDALYLYVGAEVQQMTSE